MIKFRFALILAALLPVASHAATGGEEDNMRINRLSATDFEVVAGSFTATAEYFWCGAASFIERRSGRPADTPIYIKRPVGPSSTSPRKSVIFTTSNAGLPTPAAGLTLDIDQSGIMLKSYRARQFCRDAFTRSTK